VASYDPLRIVVRQSGGTFLVLPNQSLEREVNADELIGAHQRRSALGIAEDSEVRRWQTHIGLYSLRGMIHVSKRGEAFCFHCGFEPLHRLLRTESALNCNHSMLGVGLSLQNWRGLCQQDRRPYQDKQYRSSDRILKSQKSSVAAICDVRFYGLSIAALCIREGRTCRRRSRLALGRAVSFR